MLIIGMSHFNQNDYPQARDWFRKAVRKSPRHPIATRYIALLQEIEHRFGPFSTDIATAQESADPVISGEAFKKGWFGHGFPHESPKTDKYFDPAKNIPAPVALEVEPPIKKILIEKSVAKMADEAFQNKLYLKSYLFYSQLLSAEPQNRKYLLGKADSAFQLKRYDEVVQILGPIMLAATPEKLENEDMQKAQKLMQAAREKVYSMMTGD
jgi:tetratricopeptide (TPR) repeat protein